MHLQLHRCSSQSLAKCQVFVKRVFGLCLVLMLASCASTTVYPPADVEDRDVVLNEPFDGPLESDDIDTGTGLSIEGLEAEDLNSSRAQYYRDQAQQGGSRESRTDAALSSAEYYIQADDYANAEAVASELDGARLDLVQSHRLQVIRAYVAFAQQDYANTLYELRPVIEYRPPVEPAIDDDEQIRIPAQPRLSTQQVDALLLSSFAHQKLGDFGAAINALIQREGSLVGSARSETTRYIWQVIDSLTQEEKQQIIDTTPHLLVRNRLEQSLGTQVGDAPLAPSQFNQWREELSSLEKQTIEGGWSASSPRNIAVLLPLSSRFATAANAVKDGIEYQHSQNRSPSRPELRFYDIGGNPFQTIQYYSAAIQSGADFIIGPLGKDYANQVNGYGGSGTPTLLLGGDTQLASGITRFGMGPETEGERVAERAWKDGHLSAVLLVPEDEASQRTVNAFTQRWLSFGGKISKVINYSPRQYDHSVELKQLFDINQSQYRYTRLSRTLGFKPEFTPYRRADIDFIFLIADNKTGRLIRPQINFFSGSKVPVYATSSVFNGIQDPVNNIDLDQTRFPVMPWVMRSVKVAPYAGQLNMLFALGSDAYSIAGNYQYLRNDVDSALNGNTGQISMNPYGELIYQPVWARFNEGMVEPDNTLGIDITPLGAPNDGNMERSNVNGNYNDSNWDSSNGKPRRRSGS